MPDPTQDDAFAATLRRAIEQRGLGLERLREHLQARGVQVSVATLSYWQSGRSQPERKGSLAALPHLEELLGLAPGALRSALQPPRHRGRGVAQVDDLEVVWRESPGARALLELDTRWDSELERLSHHDILSIGADRTEQSLTVRQVLRARTDGPDRCVVMHAADDVAAALPLVRPVQGGRAGRTASVPEWGVVAVELLFAAPLRRGQTVVVEHEVLTCPPRPREVRYSRRRRMPMREYLLEVRFDPGARPATCESYDPRTGETLATLEVDRWGTVHLVELDAQPGALGIRWDWPSGTDSDAAVAQS